MLTTISSYLNESFNKDKSVVIEVMEPDEMKEFIKDLESWGYYYNKVYTPYEVLHYEYYYPLIVSFSAPKLTPEFFIQTSDAFDDVSEEDFYSLNVYSYLTEFYEDKEAFNYIKYGLAKKTPNYKPRKIERTLESVENIPYRFKTRQEFVKDFGNNFRSETGWGKFGDMDYLFGTKLDGVSEEKIKDGGFLIPRKNDPNASWYISSDWITKEPLKPSYEPKKFNRTLESLSTRYNNPITKKLTKWPYRFKTEEEFNETCRSDGNRRWNCGEVHFTEYMHHLFGQTLEHDFPESQSKILIPRETIQDVWHITRPMLVRNEIGRPDYNPRKIERTLEGTKPYPYRFKTEEEFENEFGSDWRSAVCHAWESPDMDQLFGVDYPFYVDKNKESSYDLPEVTTPDIYEEYDGEEITVESGDVWMISWDMLTPNRPKVPSYQPRKSERTLESLMMPKFPERFLSESPWDVIIFRYNTREGMERTRDYINQFGIFIYYVSMSGVYTADVYMVLRSTMSLRKNNIYEVTQRYYDSGDFQRSYPQVVICPTILNMDDSTDQADIFFNTHIFKSFPSYQPKRIDRTLDVNESMTNKTKYNFLIFKFEDQEEFAKGQDILRENGFTWRSTDYTILENERDFPCYLFVQGKRNDNWDNHIYYDTERGLDGGSPFVTVTNRGKGASMEEVCPRIFTVEHAAEVNKLFNYSPAPNYAPKKIERTLESLSNRMFDNAVFKVNNPKENIICQNELFKFGFKWQYEGNLKTRSFDPNDYPVYIFAETENPHSSEPLLQHMDREGISYYGSDKDYIQECINNGEKLCPTIFKFDDAKNIESILRYGTKSPNYQPRKFDKTFESFGKKVLWAFDMDDTLVYSKRFEEHIKPLLVKEEFLTPEIILNNKVDDIGIKIGDLKYEHGRVYFDDPKQTINISNNPSWVRKGDRVYITQPDAYFLTEESMPVGTHQKIVDVYNHVENKAIITSRRERLRKQTETAIKSLGIKLPNCGLFMYPSDSLVFQAKWKALKLEELYNEGFTEIHYFDDNIKVLKRIKSYLGKQGINITLYKVNENNYRKI